MQGVACGLLARLKARPDIQPWLGLSPGRDPIMITRKALLPALLWTLVLSAAPAFAAQQSTRPAAAEQEVNAKQPSKAELRAFEQVKVSITNAISAAEKHSNGAKVIDASFDAANGAPVFKVKTYTNNSVWEGMVDAQSGQVVGDGKATPESELDREDHAELMGLRQATTTLAQAVDVAEKRAKGKVISAGLEETNGKIVYEVMVVKNGSVRKVVIDPKTGQVAAR
jgi:uncharacterized membrane protein YkoI